MRNVAFRRILTVASIILVVIIASLLVKNGVKNEQYKRQTAELQKNIGQYTVYLDGTKLDNLDGIYLVNYSYKVNGDAMTIFLTTK